MTDAIDTAPWARLRPLVWDKHPSAKMWRVQTIIGQYVVSKHDGKTVWTFDGWDRAASRVVGDAADADAAKAAAAEHFRQSLLSPFDLNAESGFASGQDLFAQFSRPGPPRFDVGHLTEAPLRGSELSKIEETT